ncbi:ABC transporter permease [Anaerotruncus colihominis]|uniref:ABC transporter permease n=1 Tax=Anaerotruncus colihominis TaxID=169435 RepID=UPI00189AE281|nr:ABC transporter permease [Anaerotruncus colihominis]
MQEILAGMIRTATPVLLAAMGGLLCEKAGVFNIALEGMMLFGAFFGVLGVYATGSLAAGVAAALAVGAAAGLLYTFIVEELRANATIVSIGLNTFAVGITTYLMKIVFGDAGSVGSDRIVGLPQVDIPLLENIPLIGRILNGHTILVYAALVIVVLLHLLLYHTQAGIGIRAVGERPAAAASAGLSVRRYRFASVMAAGMLCGLAGVHLSLGYVTLFSENMTGGRGFFAYTAVVFGQADPLIVMIASFLFGLAETVTYRAQQTGLPGPLVLTVPYVVTLIALIVRSRRRKPAAKYTKAAPAKAPAP